MQASKITDSLWIATECVIIQGSKTSEPNSILLGEMIRDASKRPIVFNSHDEALTYVRQFLKSE